MTPDESKCDEIAPAVTTRFEQGYNIGVPQVRRRFRFAQNALDVLRCRESARLGHLESHFAVELGVMRPVNDPEGALSKLLQYYETADPIKSYLLVGDA
jgi:hypothetical protein